MHAVDLLMNPCIINIAACCCHPFKHVVSLTHAWGHCLEQIESNIKFLGTYMPICVLLWIKHVNLWYLHGNMCISDFKTGTVTTIRRDLLWSTMATGMASVDIGSHASLSVPTQPAVKPSNNLYYVNFANTVFYSFPCVHFSVRCGTTRAAVCKMDRITSYF